MGALDAPRHKGTKARRDVPETSPPAWWRCPWSWRSLAFLGDLPPGVDPCGENGEFHTVVVDGPGFSRPIEVVIGQTVARDGFVFADVIPRPPS